jgi:proteasome assembly chaperone (PAC2) family protein
LARVLFSEGFPGIGHACQAKCSHLVEGGMCQQLMFLLC